MATVVSQHRKQFVLDDVQPFLHVTCESYPVGQFASGVVPNVFEVNNTTRHLAERSFKKEISAACIESHRYETHPAFRLDLKKALHLPYDKCLRLQGGGSVGEVTTECIAKVKHEFHAAVRQNPLTSCIEDCLIAFLRPNALDKGSKRRLDWICRSWSRSCRTCASSGTSRSPG